MRHTYYIAAARRMRALADRIERYASPQTPRDLASLTRVIHAASIHARRLSDRHRNGRASAGVRP